MKKITTSFIFVLLSVIFLSVSPSVARAGWVDNLFELFSGNSSQEQDLNEDANFSDNSIPGAFGAGATPPTSQLAVASGAPQTSFNFDKAIEFCNSLKKRGADAPLEEDERALCINKAIQDKVTDVMTSQNFKSLRVTQINKIIDDIKDKTSCSSGCYYNTQPKYAIASSVLYALKVYAERDYDDERGRKPIYKRVYDMDDDLKKSIDALHIGFRHFPCSLVFNTTKLISKSVSDRSKLIDGYISKLKQEKNSTQKKQADYNKAIDTLKEAKKGITQELSQGVADILGYMGSPYNRKFYAFDPDSNLQEIGKYLQGKKANCKEDMLKKLQKDQANYALCTSRAQGDIHTKGMKNLCCVEANKKDDGGWKKGFEWCANVKDSGGGAGQTKEGGTGDRDNSNLTQTVNRSEKSDKLQTVNRSEKSDKLSKYRISIANNEVKCTVDNSGEYLSKEKCEEKLQKAIYASDTFLENNVAANHKKCIQTKYNGDQVIYCAKTLTGSTFSLVFELVKYGINDVPEIHKSYQYALDLNGVDISQSNKREALIFTSPRACYAVKKVLGLKALNKCIYLRNLTHCTVPVLSYKVKGTTEVKWTNHARIKESECKTFLDKYGIKLKIDGASKTFICKGRGSADLKLKDPPIIKGYMLSPKYECKNGTPQKTDGYDLYCFKRSFLWVGNDTSWTESIAKAKAHFEDVKIKPPKTCAEINVKPARETQSSQWEQFNYGYPDDGALCYITGTAMFGQNWKCTKEQGAKCPKGKKCFVFYHDSYTNTKKLKDRDCKKNGYGFSCKPPIQQETQPQPPTSQSCPQGQIKQGGECVASPTSSPAAPPTTAPPPAKGCLPPAKPRAQFQNKCLTDNQYNALLAQLKAKQNREKFAQMQKKLQLEYQRRMAELRKKYAQSAKQRADALKKAQEEYKRKMAQMQKQMRASQAQQARSAAARSQARQNLQRRMSRANVNKRIYEPKCALIASEEKTLVNEPVTISWDSSPSLVIKNVSLRYTDGWGKVQTSSVSLNGKKKVVPRKPGRYQFKITATGYVGKSCIDEVEFEAIAPKKTATSTTLYTTHEPPKTYALIERPVPPATKEAFASLFVAYNPILTGEQAILRWKANQSCKLVGEGIKSNSVAPVGQQLTAPLTRPGTYTYILSCGSARSSVAVVVLQRQVSAPPVPRVNYQNPLPQVTDQTARNQCPVFTTYLKKGSVNGEVALVESFLRKFGYFFGIPDNTFDEETEIAVKAFQSAHAKAILKAPWGLRNSTGMWYISTRAYANKLMGCIDPTYDSDSGRRLR